MRIDAVIPTYDRAELVVRAVESALAQSRRPDAVIVVDDGSTDGTAEALSRFGDAVSCLALPRRGAAAARNAGVEMSKADFVAFLDSDDVWDEGHLGRMVRTIATTSGAAWLYFSDLRFAAGRDGAASIWEACGFALNGEHELQHDASAWGLRSRQPMMMPAAVVQRAAYLALGGLAENLVSREDTHLFLNLCLGGPACAVAGNAGEASASSEGLSRRELNTISYWQCTRWLYADVLERHPRLEPEQQAVLRERLAEAEWQLARASVRAPFRAVGHLTRSMRIDRRVALEHARRFSGRAARRAPQPRLSR